MYRILLILALSALIPIFAGCTDDSAGPEDANIPSVKICEQVWMQKNLDVSHYRNGDPIPQVTDPTEWSQLTTGAWCYYNNDPALGAIYGKLYNCYAVNDPRGLAPEDWHIPTDIEWTILADCLGGAEMAGGKLKSAGVKEVGNGLWYSPNIGATNVSGFSAIPGGKRGASGAFELLWSDGGWWTSTQEGATSSWSRGLQSNHSHLDRYDNNKLTAYSVRCIRD